MTLHWTLSPAWDWNPGSDHARDRGCTCDAKDNDYGNGDWLGRYDVDPYCEMHGEQDEK